MSENQNWTSERKAEAVLDIIKGKISLDDYCRTNDLTQSDVERWIDDFIKHGTLGLLSNSEDHPSEQQEYICELTIGWRCRGAVFTGNPMKGSDTMSEAEF